MIIHSFEPDAPGIVSLEAFYGAQKHLCDRCIVTFSRKILDEVLSGHDCRKIAEIGACNGHVPIYALEHAGRTVAFYLSAVGSAMAAEDVIEANWLTGATKFVMFGSAGSLNGQATSGRYVIPEAAYRDEGMSYHYAAPADYIAVPGADRVAEVFAELGVPFVRGKAWTTDAILRETRAQMRARAAEGCLAVEMELAGVQAVCAYHGFELYDFLMTGDVLDAPEYDMSGLSRANHLPDNFRLALELAVRV